MDQLKDAETLKQFQKLYVDLGDLRSEIWKTIVAIKADLGKDAGSVRWRIKQAVPELPPCTALIESDDPWTKTCIAKKLDMPESTVYHHLMNMVNKGEIYRADGRNPTTGRWIAVYFRCYDGRPMKGFRNYQSWQTAPYGNYRNRMSSPGFVKGDTRWDGTPEKLYEW